MVLGGWRTMPWRRKERNRILEEKRWKKMKNEGKEL